jgi:hypothetical protein
MGIINSIANILRFHRRNWKAVVLCFVAATVFWFFNALNKTYTTTITFPLAFGYDEENFVAVGNLPEQVRLNVTGNGWELFKRSTGVKRESLEIPLERPAEVKKIVGSGLKFSFTNQLNGLEINHVLTDTIYLDLETKAERWIKLRVDSVQYNLRKGYGLTSDIAVIPDSVLIQGPQRIVDRVKSPFRLAIPQRNIDEQYIADVAIELPFPEVTVSRPTVSVMFNVEEIVTISDSIRLEVTNIPPEVNDVMNAVRVPVVLALPESYASPAVIDSLVAVVDLRDFQGGTEKKLPRIQNLPPYSTVVRIDSVVVSL